MSQHNQYWAQNEIPGTERTSQLYSNEFTPFQSSNHFTDLSDHHVPTARDFEMFHCYA
jgi:hypothetical protein